MPSGPMPLALNPLFLILFRTAYLFNILIYTAFTVLGLKYCGTVIGLGASIIVAIGSEIAFVYAREEEGRLWKQERYMV
ncbi:hypothetical protein P153DRAFT_364203 [Dothidotthia symphoricarpi CBS 119687]|uniref:Copper transporter n=1 Tax=Dothidotthia symphoricarpi CBS 119687 TaxID=1392245 RepID=A0A6A6ALY9_9PLEO|nr:uncharacterized protein P153DRAFT_364203 [Dothidotthia symphoricarpi CBS 119687]KAF2132949.1 hypothetical protein P153DRAFT_364203 [Dothidotthia symphoricarpi CBS 119687]